MDKILEKLRSLEFLMGDFTVEKDFSLSPGVKNKILFRVAETPDLIGTLEIDGEKVSSIGAGWIKIDYEEAEIFITLAEHSKKRGHFVMGLPGKSLIKRT